MLGGANAKSEGLGHKLLAIAHGSWPVVAALFIFLIFYFQIDSGGILDASRWPSALFPSCSGGDPHCLAIRQMDILIRIVTMCAALFAVFNLRDHVLVIARANSDDQEDIKAKLIGTVRYLSVFFALLGCAFWVALTWSLKPGQFFTEEWLVISLFLIFTLTDVVFMLHSAEQIEAVNRDYFFANAFFVDVPTLVGVIAVLLFSASITGRAFGPGQDEIVRAISGGGIVMHVIVSQVVLASLNVQLHLKKAQPSGQS
jgi:hypothetical protein